MTYDDKARRETPLALKLKDRIRNAGPMTVAEFMRVCLHDPEYGYYVKQPAIGRAGDFITAPEISQIFGELIGLWCAVVWQQMGAPARVNLVELGPGRGTLMRDALRAARKVPGFVAALDVHLVEQSQPLREAQEQTLAGCGVPFSFHASAGGLLSGEENLGRDPVILVANEFLDTFGVQQFLFDGLSWRPRKVGLDAQDNLGYVVGAVECGRPQSLPLGVVPQDGAIFEEAVEGPLFAAVEFGRCSRIRPFAALLIDYGHQSTSFGDTLQAVAGHSPVSPFHAPGKADLTVQVDFAQFAQACRNSKDGPLAVDGPLTQGEFLGRLGIVERASRLMSANPAMAAGIEMSVARLIAPQGMGSRFQALGVRSPVLPKLPGFG
jgi:SAM-dependent MidA family methyltransferase